MVKLWGVFKDWQKLKFYKLQNQCCFMASHGMLHPQEVEVYIVLPAIRRELSLFMKKMGMDQKDIAKKLGVTDAAISQYLKDKRGQAEIAFPKEILPEFESAAKAIKQGSPMRGEIQRLLNMVMQSQFTCQVHRKVCGSLPKECVVCFEKSRSVAKKVFEGAKQIPEKR